MPSSFLNLKNICSNFSVDFFAIYFFFALLSNISYTINKYGNLGIVGFNASHLVPNAFAQVCNGFYECDATCTKNYKDSTECNE